jgi:predicted molibdopterin-dependent oxidoreductase YjgC
MSQDFILTTCPFCGTGCNFYLQVLDGEIVDVVPCKGHPVSRGELCVLGRKSHQYVQNSDRLTAPLIKKNGTFEEASWEEALRYVAERLSRIKEASGPQSLGLLASAKCSNEENYLLMKLARGVLGTNSIDHCARL